MADIKVAYGSSSALTITLASMATSSTLLTGRESAVVDNTTNKYIDYLVGGKVTTGTSPTAGAIEIWAYGQQEDTPTYPDVITGADAAITLSSIAVKGPALKPVAIIPTDATSNRSYAFGPVSIADLFGAMPKRWGLFITHNTVVVLHATGSNHACFATPIFATSA